MDWAILLTLAEHVGAHRSVLSKTAGWSSPLCDAGFVEVVFERTGRRSYAVEVLRPGAPVLRMDPAPGFDRWFPHDLQHLIVEEQLGIKNGIFGRLAKGGTASTFRPVATAGPGDARAASRQRRRLKKRNASLGENGSTDFARSERATYVAWHDWLAQSLDTSLQAQASDMAPTARSTLDCMSQSERSALEAALPRLRVRIGAVAAEWASLGIGESMKVTWSPLRS